MLRRSTTNLNRQNRSSHRIISRLVNASRPVIEGLEDRRLMAVADGFEADNSFGTAKTITTDGSSQTHSIHVGGDVDFVKFALSTPSAVLIETRTDLPSGSTGADMYGTLYNNSFSQIAVSDDEGNGLNAQIVRFGSQRLAAGTYYFAAKSYYQTATVDRYTIRVQITPDFGLSAYQSSNPFWVNRSVPKSIRSDSYLGSALGNCTWYSVGRSIELGASPTTMSAFNGQLANNFDTAATNRGITVVAAASAAFSDVRIGDIMQIDRASQGVAGHVATIERVNGDSSGRITSVDVSQSSYAGNSPQQGDTADYLYKRGTWSIGQISNFLLVQPRNGTTNSAPAAPSNVSGTASSSSRVDLTWRDNAANEQGFKVFRWNGSNWQQIGTVGANSTGYSDSGRAANTTYYYTVSAYNGVGENSATTYATVTTPAQTSTAPIAPSGLVATAPSASRVDLSWRDNSTNELGFKVSRWNGSSWQQIATLGANATSFSDTGRAANTTYYYLVSAYNSVGDSWAAGYATVTTPNGSSSTSQAPTNFRWEPTGGGSGVFRWNDNSSAETGFQIQWQSSSDGTWYSLGAPFAANTTQSGSWGFDSSRYVLRIVAIQQVNGQTIELGASNIFVINP